MEVINQKVAVVGHSRGRRSVDYTYDESRKMEYWGLERLKQGPAEDYGGN